MNDPARSPARTAPIVVDRAVRRIRRLALAALLCPEGELRWVLVRVQLSLASGAAPRSVVHEERWRLRPRFLSFFESEQVRQMESDSVVYRTEQQRGRIRATEVFDPNQPKTFGAPAELLLEALGGTPADAMANDAAQLLQRIRARCSPSRSPP